MHIYLLSVLSTIAAGATLAADYLVDKMPVLEPLRRFAASSRAKGMLGATALAIGVVKLFWRVPGEVIIVGDFLPAISGMLLGAMLMIDRYRERQLLGDSVEPATVGSETVEDDATPKLSDSGVTGIAEIGDALKPYRTPLGLAGIAAGVIHFLLANVIFL